MPLVGIATDKTLEILETHAGRPLIIWPHLAGGKRRGVVILAEPGSGVTVIEQNPSDGSLILGDDAVITGETRGLFGNYTETGRMMVATGDKRGSRVNVVVAQTVVCDTIHSGCRNDAAKSAGHAKPCIIRDDEQHVGGLLGRHNARGPPRFRSQGVIVDHAGEFRFRCWQLVAADGSGGARRAQGTGDLQSAGWFLGFFASSFTGFAL